MNLTAKNELHKVKRNKTSLFVIKQRLNEFMSSVSDQEVDDVAEKIVSEVEHAKTADLAKSDEMVKILHLTDTQRAKTLLDHAAEAPTESERDNRQEGCCQGTACFNVAVEALLHHQVDHHEPLGSLAYFNFHIDFSLDKLVFGNSLRNLHFRLFTGSFEAAGRSNSKSHSAHR